MNKLAITALVLQVPFFSLKAQNETDALRYSFLKPSGSARFVSMGGAMGAMGGDLSNISNNPAGIGIYRRGDFGVSASVINSRTTATHYGSQNIDNRLNFNLPNFGLVISNDVRNPRTPLEGWQFVNFGIAHQRINHFQGRQFIEGINNESSLLDVYQQQANDGTFSQFGNQLALNTQLLLDNGDGTFSTFGDGFPNVDKLQRRTVESKGAMGETNVAIGANYGNFLYLGASAGISRIRYEATTNHFEQDVNNLVNEFDNFNVEEFLRARGTGVNLKLGVIVRPIDFLRVSLAYHTPTSFRVNETYFTNMRAEYDDFSNPFSSVSPIGEFSYRFQMPSRIQIGVAGTIMRLAIIGVEYEFINYSNSNFRSSETSFSNVNQTISSNLQPGHNIRFGGEYRMDALRFRAGMSLLSNPYAPQIDNRAGATFINFGMGYRAMDGFYIDAAYSIGMMSENYWLYNPEIIRATRLGHNVGNFILTMGINF